MGISIKVKNGFYDLVESGDIIIDSSDITTFTVENNGEDPIDIIFKFEDSEKEPNALTKEAKVINQTTLEIIFKNYNSVLGSYNKEPWEIGFIANRKLYLMYVISAFSETKLKKVNYSFYLGEEVING